MSERFTLSDQMWPPTDTNANEQKLLPFVQESERFAHKKCLKIWYLPEKHDRVAVEGRIVVDALQRRSAPRTKR